VTESLSAAELDFLWEALGAGEPPYPLDIPSHGATLDERAALRRQVLDRLRTRGLVGHADRVDQRTANWVGVVAQPALSIDSVFLPELDAEPVRALAALRHGTAVLATQSSAGLTVRQLDPGGLIQAIVDLLPPTPRGTELSISVPVEEFAAAAGAHGARPGRAGGTQTAAALARLTSLPRRRGGQITANSLGELGARRRSAVLFWFDNDTGRYLGQAQRSSDDRQWATVAPADQAGMRQRIAEMVAVVTAADRREPSAPSHR
jgi:hypothetical protein